MGKENNVKVYWASTTHNRMIASQQMRLKQIVGGERLVVEWIDITTGSNLLREMRSLCGNEKALPPQIFHGTEYLGVSLFSKDKKDRSTIFRTIKQVLIISRQDKYCKGHF